ncbi:hypothetical protein [Duganella sp. BuS-21]|uniref:hypothetical protein n=1 Tax=Duganella sp. BuS-21 TaxID=2943848 RepID=UPI0035A66EFF
MTSRPNRINIDLGAYKQRWLDYCHAHQVTPSAAFRQVVAKLTEAQLVDDANGTDAVSQNKNSKQQGTREPVRKIRRQLLLTVDEAEFIRMAARHQGLSELRWMIALLRSVMHGGPQLGPIEMEALGKSNLALLSIGRNLNQIARALNAQQAVEHVALIAVLGALRVQFTTHIDEVAVVLSRNAARWSRS